MFACGLGLVVGAKYRRDNWNSPLCFCLALVFPGLCYVVNFTLFAVCFTAGIPDMGWVQQVSPKTGRRCPAEETQNGRDAWAGALAVLTRGIS